ncbi:MAG: PDZ domain-containing protein [Actinomycetia bacterium]|nr:PDZ domain-containing protein [Actinomycetes bacterium]
MSSSYARYPHLSGDDIVFVADDDLWVVATEGGRAARLTSEHQPVRNPRFSPDRRRIAYTRQVGAAFEVLVLEVATGEVTQLTYWGVAQTAVDGWLDNRHVLVASSGGQPYRVRITLRSVSLDGASEELAYGVAMSGAFRGSSVAITTPYWRDLAAWKRYRGGTAPQLWLKRSAGDWFRPLPQETAGIYSPTWVGDRLVFASDLGATFPDQTDEQGQLWSLDASGQDLTQHTHHGPDLGFVRNPTSDGSRVVYHARGRVYLMESLRSEPREVPIRLPVPVRPFTPAPTERLQEIQPDHGGDLSVVSWYGAVYALTHRAGPARALSADPGVRARLPRVLGTTGRAVYVSDATGDDCLEIVSLDGSGDPRRIVKGKLGRVLALAAAPDGASIGVITSDGRICAVRVSDARVTELGTSPHGEATDLAYSPDGRYLVWVAPTATGFTTRLWCADLKARRSLGEPLTSGRFHDYSPAFTRDGQHLVFLSGRTFDPRYDELGFDLGFTSSVRPYLVPLSASAPAPFGAAADGWPVSRPQSTDGDDQKKTAPVVSAELDGDSFEERMVPFPVPSGSYQGLRAVKDGVVWRRAVAVDGELGTTRCGVEGEREHDLLEQFSFETRRVTELGRADSFEVSGDGEQVVLRLKDEVVVVPATSKVDKDDPARVGVDLARLRRTFDPRPMWRQMFEENGRLMRDFYWREDMDGTDWAAVLDRYRPVVRLVRTRDDLVDILWETVGELNSSHAYVNPPVPGGPQQGLLGADLDNSASGAVIVRILPGEASDPRARSPLRAAGVDAQPGDVIVAVDGQEVGARGVGPLLRGAADQVVELTLLRGKERRRVAVVPVASEQPLRYQAWVASRIAYVERVSEGRLGYLHVPDMMAEGWAQLHRGLDQAMAHEGVVADMRYNSGGHTSQLVIERLSRRIIGWDLVRHGAPEPYPFQGRRGPVVFVTNQFAGSDGDIVCAAAQELGLGPVVGQRSWGGVIGIDGRFDLVDGTSVTQPRYSFYFDKHGWDLENHGVDPDIEYLMSPADWDDEDVRDPQLDLAVAEALRLLEETPAQQPPELPAPRVRAKD